MCAISALNAVLRSWARAKGLPGKYGIAVTAVKSAGATCARGIWEIVFGSSTRIDFLIDST
jgi:hypothetical protein